MFNIDMFVLVLDQIFSHTCVEGILKHTEDDYAWINIDMFVLGLDQIISHICVEGILKHAEDDYACLNIYMIVLGLDQIFTERRKRRLCLVQYWYVCTGIGPDIY